MLFARLDPRAAMTVRLIMLAVVTWSVLHSHPGPGASRRGLLILCLLIAAVVAYLVWTAWPMRGPEVTLELYALAVTGGVLTVAASDGAASVLVFVAVVAAGVRVEISRAVPLVLVGTLALAVSVLVYDASALGLLAYALGFAAALLAASNGRQARVRADQAELLLAQAQRTAEEQLRTARLEETTRIAREIHDVLAHALAGLTIQLEATRTLVEQGADRATVLERVARAHALAREGLQETRRAVGALRGDQVAVPDAIQSLVEEYRAVGRGEIGLTFDGDPERLTGNTGLAVLRTVQEALTNVHKHAPGATVSVSVHAGRAPGEDVLATICNRPTGDDGRPDAGASSLSNAGGGYGLQGMRERAQALGGTLSAGVAGEGWQVVLRLPARTPIPESPQTAR
jgi:signal transduction histidine kinase